MTKEDKTFIDKWSGFLADLLAIPKIPIKIDNRIKTFGRFNITDDKIYISYNKKKLDNLKTSWLDILKVITHEYRHYYQTYCITYEKEMSEIEGNKKLDLWKRELMNYKPYGDKDYSNQNIEIDSVSFTLMIFIYFDIMIEEDYSIYDKDKVDRELSNFLMDYTKEEIIDSIEYVDLDYNVLKQYLKDMVIKKNRG